MADRMTDYRACEKTVVFVMHATGVYSVYKKLFPFSDNLTTLIFIVVSDLSEVQRERLTSSFSLR